MKRKGIVLAGGAGTRLYPTTLAISKQLLPVFDKPMIYYPITTLMLAGIREMLIITTQRDLSRFEELLGDGSRWGMEFTYKIQPESGGIAQALLLGEDYLGDSTCALILGDNIFYGHRLQELLVASASQSDGATLFAYHVNHPERYGVIEFNDKRQAIDIQEKPANPRSNYAATGLYFYDSSAVSLAKTLRPSLRGELEITDLNRLYLETSNLHVEVMGRGFVWFDTGTHESMLEASQFVGSIENRQGLKVCCPEEVAFRQGWIDANQLETLAIPLENSRYGKYLLGLLH